MRNLLVIMFVAIVNYSFGQNIFEGHIAFNISNISKGSSSKFMDIYIKKDKVKIQLAKKSYKPTVFIYDLKNGISYDINEEQKLTISDSLKKKYLLSPFRYDSVAGISKKIDGYDCAKFYMLPEKETNTYLLGVNAWFASLLFFPIPDSFRFLQPFIFFNGKNISLETETIMRNMENQSVDTISIKAVSIEKVDLPDSLFEIDNTYSIMTMDEFQKKVINN